MTAPLDQLIDDLGRQSPHPVYLVHGDLVVSEPAARRIAEAVARVAGCEVDERRHPERLSSVLDDLRTFSLFDPAKVILVVDSAVLADRESAAALIDQAEKGLPAPPPDESLSGSGRQAASRLLQALNLFDLDVADGDAEDLLDRLPDWVLAGAKKGGGRKRARTKKQIATLREQLAQLLDAARSSGLTGWAEGDLAQLSGVVRDGLPEGHCLVLAERGVAKEHPVVQALAQQKAVLALASVTATKQGGFEGLDELAAELYRQTGVGITRDAQEELARRTLRQSSDWGDSSVRSETTARFAAEYRKLATTAKSGRIDKQLVQDTILDRGEEDVWQILDAIGAGRPQEATDRLRRFLAAAEDPMATRLSFFALFAGFCRQLLAVRSMMRVARIPPGEKNYNRFKSRHAPALQQELSVPGKNPLGGLHPYRLHRAYLAASRLPDAVLSVLPWRVLETEMMLKGESTDPDGALAALVSSLARPA
jgi:hypothetical protein